MQETRSPAAPAAGLLSWAGKHPVPCAGLPPDNALPRSQIAVPLHPPIEPFDSFRLAVGDGHEIHVEQAGNPQGVPVLYLHGGPGSGAGARIRRLFDPARTRAILFDQRGAGRSTPHGSLDANTTAHLLRDIEAIRTRLGIGRWVLFGGSWGATLALAYAMAHPRRVSAMVLYGIFLCRRRELDALYGANGVAAALFPDVYEDFAALLPPGTDDPVAAYGAMFAASDPALRRDALRRWTALERAVSRLLPDPEALSEELADEDYVLAHSLIENHYFRHGGFIDAQAILDTAGEVLAGIPIDLIASRYDVVCPVATAYELARAIPHARLEIVPDAGHTWRDPANTAALQRRLDAAIAREAAADG